MRLTEARRDHFRKLAKKEGYRSRAAYKLRQMNSKYHFIRAQSKLVDIGCAPGGWLEISSELVGQKGVVVGVDLVRVKPVANNVQILVDDVSSDGFASRILAVLGAQADCVLADLSPKLSGIWDLDHFKQIELCQRVVDLLPQILTKGGSVVMKAFHGAELESLVERLRGSFSRVETVKPEASRKESSEIYLYGGNFSGQVPSRQKEEAPLARPSSERLGSDAFGLPDDRIPEYS